MREAYCWAQGLGCGLQVGEGNGGVGEDLRGPNFAEGGEDGSLESGKGGKDIVVVGVLVAGFDPDDLAGSQGVVAGISCLDGGAEEGGGVGVDDDCGPGFEVVDGLADEERVVVEGRGRHGYVA